MLISFNVIDRRHFNVGSAGNSRTEYADSRVTTTVMHSQSGFHRATDSATPCPSIAAEKQLDYTVKLYICILIVSPPFADRTWTLTVLRRRIVNDFQRQLNAASIATRLMIATNQRRQ
jgi:hypothetical protein